MITTRPNLSDYESRNKFNKALKVWSIDNKDEEIKWERARDLVTRRYDNILDMIDRYLSNIPMDNDNFLGPILNSIRQTMDDMHRDFVKEDLDWEYKELVEKEVNNS